MRDIIGLIILLSLLFISSSFAEERIFINSQDITVINSMSDSGSGMGNMSYSVDNQLTWTEPEPYTTQKNLILPNFDEGEHCIWAKFSDKLGNWGQPIKACAWVDLSAPDGFYEIDGIKITIEVNVN
jgi:hypothetical protein